MYSKQLMSAVALVCVVACSKPASEVKPVQLQIGGTSCLDGTFKRFQAFFQGASNAADIHTFWSCARTIVTDFNTIATGANPDKFSKDELGGFLARYFFKGDLKPDVLTSTMRLKQFLVGGDTNFITRDEIARLIVDLDKLDSITANLAPSTPIVFGGANAKAGEIEWTRAYQSFALNLEQLGEVLTASKQTYAFAEIQSLLNAWANELDLEKDSIVRKAALLMPSIGTAKTIVMAGSGKVMSPPEWHPLLAKISAAYSDYRMANRLLDMYPNDYMMALGRAEVPTTLLNVIDLLDSAVTAHPKGKISLEDVKTFLNGLQDAGFFPAKFSVDQVMQALRFALGHLLGDGHSNVDTINADQVTQARKFMARWQLTESALETGSHVSVPEFDAALRPDPIANPTWVLRLDENGRVQIPAIGPNRLNRELPVIFTAIEWVGNKWSKWPLTPDSFHSLVKDVLDFMHALGYLLGTKDTIATKLIIEGNLFMPGANGDKNLDLSEGFQYGVFAISAYHGSHALQHQSGCPETDYACLRAYLFANRATLFSNFNQLNTWLSANPGVWAAFSKNVATVVDEDQIFQQFMVYHYIETFMQRFDLSHNGLMDIDEAKQSFPLFHPALDTFLVDKGILPENQVLPFFTFLFKCGTAPDPSSLLCGPMAWEFWRWFPDVWKFNADRNILASILAQLAQLEKIPTE